MPSVRDDTYYHKSIDQNGHIITICIGVWGSFNVISKEQPVCAECAPLDPLVVLVIYLGQTVTVKQTLQLGGSKQGVLLYYKFF